MSAVRHGALHGCALVAAVAWSLVASAQAPAVAPAPRPADPARGRAATPAPLAGAPSGPRVLPADVRPTNRRPFGPGVQVQVIAPGERQVSVFVGRAADGGSRPSEYELVKVGMTPLEFELPPNESYWLEVEAPDVTRGGLRLSMGQQPERVLVDTGSSDMADLGSLALAIGALSVIAATVVLASGSQGESGIDKASIVIPLYAGGAAVLGGGIALYFASRTELEAGSGSHAARPPGRPRDAAQLPRPVVGLSVSF